MPLILDYQYLVNQKVGLPQFYKLFSNNDECLELYFRLRFEGRNCQKCSRNIVSNYRRINRPDKNGTPKKSFRCRSCATYIYPFANTIFEKTTIPITHIFYTIFSLCIGRSSVSAVDVVSNIGCSYKTAHRLMKLIRMLLYDDATYKMRGTIEVDEAFMAKGQKYNNWGGISTRKQPIIGLVERETKYARLFLVKNRNARTINKLIRQNVERGSTIYTDSWKGYTDLKDHYNHEIIDHSKQEYVLGNVSTNSIESIWAHFKRNIRKAHVQISDKYVHLYLAEACWRHNSKGKLPMQLFNEILLRSFSIFDSTFDKEIKPLLVAKVSVIDLP